jgi:hypothetical protein
MMIPSFFAKASGPVALMWLSLQDRISSQWITTVVLDGVLAILFLVAFWMTGQESASK